MRQQIAALFVMLGLGRVAAAEEVAAAIERVVITAPGVVDTAEVPTFVAAEAADLDVGVIVPRALAGAHLVEIELVTPNGFVYQRFAVPVDDAESPPAARAVPGFPRPLAVQRLQPLTVLGAAKKVARLRLPLAGTAIVKSGLYGTWTARVILDGRERTAVVARFDLVDRPGRRVEELRR